MTISASCPDGAEPTRRRGRRWWTSRARSAFSRRHRIIVVPLGAALIAGALVAAVPAPALGQVAAASRASAGPACIVSPILVNSCRPLLGAAAVGNPGIPGKSAPGTGPIPQFEYLEKLVGHRLDTFRDYHDCNGSVCSSGGLPFAPGNSQGQAEIYFAKHGVAVDSNWKPASTWAAADGGNSAVNAAIAQVAKNIRAVAPHKVFLTVWVEPQSGVSASASTTCTKGLKGSAGTPQQYIKMWANVEAIFRAQHVTNVVWAMDYMSDPKYNCLVPLLWPGHATDIDWVFYDSYDHDNSGGTTFANTAGSFYNFLAGNPGGIDFAAKPWGLGEFDTCKNPSVSNAQRYYLDAKKAVAANTYPNLKLYQVFAVSNAHTSPGCLTDYDPNGAYDPTKQADFNQLAGWVLSGNSPA